MSFLGWQGRGRYLITCPSAFILLLQGISVIKEPSLPARGMVCFALVPTRFGKVQGGEQRDFLGGFRHGDEETRSGPIWLGDVGWVQGTRTGEHLWSSCACGSVWLCPRLYKSPPVGLMLAVGMLAHMSITCVFLRSCGTFIPSALGCFTWSTKAAAPCCIVSDAVKLLSLDETQILPPSAGLLETCRVRAFLGQILGKPGAALRELKPCCCLEVTRRSGAICQPERAE